MKIAFKDSKILMINGRTLILEVGQEPEPPTPTFDEVTIGTQTWMAKNLSIDDGGEGIYTQTVNYGQGDVTEYYYTYEAAVRVAAAVDGWHLPTKEEWETLENAAGGDYVAGDCLKSTYGWTGWNGTDDYGFSGLPSGLVADETLRDIGTSVYFWSISEYEWSSDYHYTAHLANYSINLDISPYWYREHKLSVRLVKD